MSVWRSGVPGPGETTMLWNSPASSRSLRASQGMSSLRMTVGSTSRHRNRDQQKYKGRFMRGERDGDDNAEKHEASIMSLGQYLH